MMTEWAVRGAIDATDTIKTKNREVYYDTVGRITTILLFGDSNKVFRVEKNRYNTSGLIISNVEYDTGGSIKRQEFYFYNANNERLKDSIVFDNGQTTVQLYEKQKQGDVMRERLKMVINGVVLHDIFTDFGLDSQVIAKGTYENDHPVKTQFFLRSPGFEIEGQYLGRVWDATVIRQYDIMNRVRSEICTNARTGDTEYSIIYKYDARGQLSEKTSRNYEHNRQVLYSYAYQYY